MANALTDLSPAQLRRAARIKEKIVSLQGELTKLVGDAAPAPAKGQRRKRRKMSAEARAKIAEAQRRRWAKQKAKQ